MPEPSAAERVDGAAAARVERVLLTGATGFVGRHALPALEAAGFEVVCATRDPGAAERRDPSRTWVRLDVDDPATLERALVGCKAALFLVHGMGDGGDYPERERQAALTFRAAVAAAGLRRIVYLGGVAPPGQAGKHLGSRLLTGELLRAGPVGTVELRAAMVIGRGSASWLIVRDLAARLPVMVLPAWLRNHSWPLGIEDVVAGLLLGLRPETAPGWYDLPGPERLSHEELLLRVAARMGRRPFTLGVPVVTPRLSSYWIRFVTRAPWGLVRELVEGLREELDPSGRLLWDVVPGHGRTPLNEAIDRALADEGLNETPSAPCEARLVALGARLGATAAGRP